MGPDAARGHSVGCVTLVLLRLAVLLNSIDAGHLNPAEAEHALQPHVHLVDDQDELLGQGPVPTLRIALAQVPRLSSAGWALALVAPGRMGGLRGPVTLTSAALRAPTEPELDVVPVVLRHDGGLAWLAETGIPAAEALDDQVVNLALSVAERPLSPPTPSEASRTLASVMGQATSALESMGLSGGNRPRPAGTVALGSSYPAANQTLLDQAMTVLAITAAAREAEPDLPHSHAVTTRAARLAPLRSAALDAVQAAVSWPAHLMV